VKIKHLSLQMPNLRGLPKEMVNMANCLEVLELEECKITELPDWLSELNKLETFSLINNGIIALNK
jgi:Leucine-rich repeat (LRR) protein